MPRSRMVVRTAISLLLVAGTACQKRPAPRPTRESDAQKPRPTVDSGSSVRTWPVPLTDLDDEQKLALYGFIPLGIHSADVIRIVPALGHQRPEGPQLTDARVATSVMGQPTPLEFNFQADTLYAVTFGPVDLAADSGDTLFARLVRHYSARLGNPIVEDEQDDPYFVKMRIWPAPCGEVVLSNALTGNRRSVGWGYQRAINTKSKP